MSPILFGSGTDQNPSLKFDAAKVRATSPIVNPPCKTRMKSALLSLHFFNTLCASFEFIGISEISIKFTPTSSQTFLTPFELLFQTLCFSGK